MLVILHGLGRFMWYCVACLCRTMDHNQAYSTQSSQALALATKRVGKIQRKYNNAYANDNLSMFVQCCCAKNEVRRNQNQHIRRNKY